MLTETSNVGVGSIILTLVLVSIGIFMLNYQKESK